MARLADDWMLYSPERERERGGKHYEGSGSLLPHAHWSVVVKWTLEGELIPSQKSSVRYNFPRT